MVYFTWYDWILLSPISLTFYIEITYVCLCHNTNKLSSLEYKHYSLKMILSSTYDHHFLEGRWCNAPIVLAEGAIFETAIPVVEMQFAHCRVKRAKWTIATSIVYSFKLITCGRSQKCATSYHIINKICVTCRNVPGALSFLVQADSHKFIWEVTRFDHVPD